MCYKSSFKEYQFFEEELISSLLCGNYCYNGLLYEWGKASKTDEATEGTSMNGRLTRNNKQEISGRKSRFNCGYSSRYFK